MKTQYLESMIEQAESRIRKCEARGRSKSARRWKRHIKFLTALGDAKGLAETGRVIDAHYSAKRESV